MNSLCLDEFKNLVLNLEETMDNEIIDELENWLDIADYTKQNSLWIFPKTKDIVKFISIAKQTKDYFEKEKLSLDVCEKLQNILHDSSNQDKYADVIVKASKIKNVCSICEKRWDEHDETELNSCQEKFQPKISTNFQRKLMSYQKIPVEYLTTIGNGANFSVPGSGKTTITYAAISKWLDDEIIEKILVIGPTAAFFPWEDEFRECFGRTPESIRIKGDAETQLNRPEKELFLMHFSTAMNKIPEIIEFLKNNKVVLIIDESHNIKSPEQRKWAQTARTIAPFADRRVILSGTPMPNDARDLWVQITFLWPYDFPLGNDVSYMRYAKVHGIGKWKSTLEPLFARITKNELNLPSDKLHYPKTIVDLSPIQYEIYNAIATKTLQEISEIRDRSRLQKFRTAKMIRMLQVASNPTLIYEKSDEFDVTREEFGIPPQKISLSSIKNWDTEIYEKIVSYSEKEIPYKLVAVTDLAKKLVDEDNEKVIIWSSFITNMEIFENQLLKKYNPILINGDVSKDENQAENRDNLIREFKEEDKRRILIATPASLAESVSLHINSKKEKVCSNAIYFDRNFNGAQFMQSMDRIHRLGMDTNTDVFYHFIMANNTIDEDIDKRLWEKFTTMSDALNDPWPHVLDYDGTSEKIDDTESQKDFKSLVESLKKSCENK